MKERDDEWKEAKVGAYKQLPAPRLEEPEPVECALDTHSEGPSDPLSRTGGEGGGLMIGDPGGLGGGEGGALAGGCPAEERERTPEKK